MIQTLLNSPIPRLYMANTGNIGDAVIRQGTIRFFQQIGLEYKEVRKIPKKNIGSFIYGGGGAWCKNWDNSYRVKNALAHAKKVIVLPSTFSIKSDLYNNKRISFFSRDREDSLTFCPRAQYHKDMAFHLEDDLIPEIGFGVGFFMRTDKESTKRFPIPLNNKDISLLGKTFDEIKPFINIINNVREIHTDRLHVAIVACMLKKKVYLYEGNYFKNKAVYSSTMKGNYDVTFRECNSG